MGADDVVRLERSRELFHRAQELVRAIEAIADELAKEQDQLEAAFARFERDGERGGG